ncbi:MAG TPA: glycoside hydrolase family 2 TIM barrel-domain containing protein [Bryobacteraceae bacterium]|nr:glycoside hydrolase family 2 TIM barrel-domain containing protein [Bryobacteraceae bacterium]
MPTRRKLLKVCAALPVAAASGATGDQLAIRTANCGGQVSLNGEWLFRLDPQGSGEREGWNRPAPSSGWRTVMVPHTWQIEPENSEYRGVAWYRKTFSAPADWATCAVRVEFEAVFHTGTVWLNGIEVGRHVGKGYTAFMLDLSPHLRAGGENILAVRVDNAFNDAMLPRGRSSDWAHDGGIYRPVQLLVTPRTFIEQITVESHPDLESHRAAIDARIRVRNSSRDAWQGSALVRVIDDATGLTMLTAPTTPMKLAAGEVITARVPTLDLPGTKLWHFDHPNLYRLTATLSSGHSYETTFGIRKIEARADGFYLNGERVRLMGVERMAGSNPEFGMAEPSPWIHHDHADLKELNCIYTRVHWPQDHRVLDWCDRHGMLIQTEVPTWGSATFEGMSGEPSPAIMNNGLEQLREMIDRDRNHPCIFSWGVCNEIGGQNPPAYAFAKRMYEESKRLDPKRLVSYASNSLFQTPGKDVSGVMDYIMCNEYVGSWTPGTPKDVARYMDEIHRAFPDKLVVISEYGYCACTPERPEGDARRTSVLREHDRVFRERDYIAGLIFFDYNDYRTHIGDRGTGVMRQRVHGVVDVYGARKPSWEVLRRESSPVAAIELSGNAGALAVMISARETVPSYRLRGYEVRAIGYGSGAIPVERIAVPLADLDSGGSARVEFRFTQPDIARILVDVMRPTGFSVASNVWES